MKQIERLGGVKWMFLTHRDDVADNAAFRRRFGCDRILHQSDVTAGTADVETKVEGLQPFHLDAGLSVIPLPGHTRGSSALLYDEKVLFTGDHLWGDSETKQLDASRGVCWYSWTEQIRSMERLLEIRFEWVLPGHGDPFRAASSAEMRRQVEDLVARMKA
jgi:glyoxylase-like metal-dependent hydrolase (beta-lactamase superfamily II)